MKTYKVTIDSRGTKRWHNAKDQLHREDGPAVEGSDGSNDYKSWWLNGQRHREDGPAVEYSDGSKEWWFNNKRLTEAEWRAQIKQQTCNGKTIVVDGKTYKLVAL